ISWRNRFGLHGRGYTWRSMAMTPLRWRRRIRVTSTSPTSSTLVPVDLRIRLPHVVRLELEQPGELFPFEPRDGQLDQRARGREGVRRRGELDAPARSLQRATVQQGAAPDHQDV